MSVVEDVRTLIQDIVAPDLKALSARLDALERAVKLGFEQSEKSVAQRFDLNEKLAPARYEAVLARIDNAVVLATANHAAVLRALDMERRMGAWNSPSPRKIRHPANQGLSSFRC